MNRTMAFASVAAILLGTAGCGGEDDHDGGSAARTATATKPAASGATVTAAGAAPAKPSSSGAGTKPPALAMIGSPADQTTSRAVVAVATRYFRAVARRDAAQVCATRTPQERKLLAEVRGSCVAAVRSQLPKIDQTAAAQARVYGVRRRGSFAVAQVRAGSRLLTARRPLIAQRVGGRWLLTERYPAPPPVHVTTADARAVRAVANRYIDAVAGHHWAAACVTRTPADRKKFADFSGGTCADGLAAVVRDNTSVRSEYAGKVTLSRNGTAKVEVRDRGLSGSAESLTAQRVGGRWLLKDAGDSYDLP